MQPYFSVVIPTYNRWPLLREALTSVTQQTCQDLEIVVVDDGSTDETQEQVERMRRPVRLLFCHRGGPARARNVGIEAARGAFVAFLDSDDLWHPEHLAGAMDLLARYPQLDFLFADARFIYVDDGKDDKASNIRDKPIETVPYDAAGSWRIFRRTIYPELVQAEAVATSSAIIRREVLQRLGGFDARWTPAEDQDLWLRVCADSPTAGNWSVTVERRKRPDGLVLSEPLWLQCSKRIGLY